MRRRVAGVSPLKLRGLRKVRAPTWAAALALAALSVAAALFVGERASIYLAEREAPASLRSAARIASLPVEPSQSVNRAKKAARETVHAPPPREANLAPEDLQRPENWKPTIEPDEPAAQTGVAAEAETGVELDTETGTAETGTAGETGRASWYQLASATASGESMDDSALTAAHRTLPLGSYARVENLDNGRIVLVRINDRGPFAENRIIDLSKAAAEGLGMIEAGVAKVRVSPVAGALAGAMTTSAQAAELAR